MISLQIFFVFEGWNSWKALELDFGIVTKLLNVLESPP